MDHRVDIARLWDDLIQGLAARAGESIPAAGTADFRLWIVLLPHGTLTLLRRLPEAIQEEASS
jgi:hypothetical protein